MSIRLVLPRGASAELQSRSQPVPLTTREWTEFHSTKFLHTKYLKLLERQPGPSASPRDQERHRLLEEQFDELHNIYSTMVEALMRTRDRIEQLQRCISALCAHNARRRSALVNFHLLEDVLTELEETEADEQGMLESIREVALEILNLG